VDLGVFIDRSVEEAWGVGGGGAADGEAGPPAKGSDDGQDEDIGSD